MTNTLLPDLASTGALSGSLQGTEDTRLVCYEPTEDGVDIVRWAVEYRAALLTALGEYGAVLVRGGVHSPELLDSVAQVIGGDLLEYTERSTPRSSVRGNVYTSTSYPASQTIPQHNEMSYANSPPRWLFFACALASATGGATPLADSTAVLRHLPGDLVQRFRERGVMYTRSYQEGMGLTWQEGFQTESRSEVEQYCARHEIEYEWAGEELRTRQRRLAVVTDSESGREAWFNQAHLFHVSTLPARARTALLSMYSLPELPRHAFYGDGQTIPDEEIALIQQAYADVLFGTPWVRGDLLVVNNLLVSHGRQPYTGDRSILVAMTGTLDIS